MENSPEVREIVSSQQLNQQPQQPRRSSIASNLSKINPQRPVVDLVVAMISVPTLIIFALMLETHMRGEWTDESSSRWTVLGLGMGLLTVSLLVCGYVTHRMGVCLWAGPQDDSDYPSPFDRINSQIDILNIIESLPPSYETVMGYDLPPPSYNDIVFIKIEKEKELDNNYDKTTINYNLQSQQTHLPLYDETINYI